MSPHRHEVIVLIGTIATGWWSHLTPVQKALASLAVVALVAFSAGGIVSQALVERTGALARLEQNERHVTRALEIAIRDSIRVDAVEMELERRAEALDRLEAIEIMVREMNGRVLRMQCLLQGNRGPACL